MSDTVSVQVALRIRPLISTEIERGCRSCLLAMPDEPQVRIVGTDKAFTYNYVFDEMATQSTVYNEAVKGQLENLFKGYNLTILAYGQTGSGKTHSMGTNYSTDSDTGIIPRVANDIFERISSTPDFQYEVGVSFVELYQETLYDLLSSKPREQSTVDIREEGKVIKMPGLTVTPVANMLQTLQCLVQGSQGRATGATAMNVQSSRSHAIFTITMSMQRKNDPNTATVSKFHLVDLAGSERSKKTKTSGERFKEGVNINRGLLALGNVISALGDENQKGFINYRDSKLTRLLQDSLGGNSLTMMIACVSPADYNMEETTSTLRYADRARRIKNKPLVNRDAKSAEIVRLHEVIQELRLQLLQAGGGGGGGDTALHLQDLQKKNRELSAALSNSLSENTVLFERLLLTQQANDQLSKRLHQLKEKFELTLSQLNQSVKAGESADVLGEQISHLAGMQREIEAVYAEHGQSVRQLRDQELQSEPAEAMGAGDSRDFDKQQEQHNAQQIALKTQLHDLNKLLAIKEHLAAQMRANSVHLVSSENEAKIAALESEKQKLLGDMDSQHQAGSLADQRRRRVRELELQIAELRQKADTLKKLKERGDEKIQQLNKDIGSMKASKVQLIKAMRLEAEKFRTWKLDQQREMSKLKNHDRKLLSQIAKMENIHSKQKNVLRRKVEEAAAINKRLKDVLAKQKTVQNSRNNGRTNSAGKAEHIKQLVEQEFELMISTAEGKITLEQLIEDRTTLSRQLQHMKQSNGDAATINPLTEEIEMRSVQIADLQQKIIDADAESLSKAKSESLQTMSDVKYAFKELMALATNERMQSLQQKEKMEELLQAKQSASENLDQLRKEFAECKRQHREELHQVESRCEEKLLMLLKEMRGRSTESSNKSMDHQCKQHERTMEEILVQLQQKDETIKGLRSRLDRILDQASNKPVKRPKMEQKHHFVYPLLGETSEEEEEDNIANDPDWHKTPLFKKMRRKDDRITGSSIFEISEKSSDNTKRTSGDNTKRTSGDKMKCSCNNKCINKRCGCRKLGSACSEQCKCSGVCDNKENATPQAQTLRELIGSRVNGDANETHSEMAGRSCFFTPESIHQTPQRKYFSAQLRKNL